MRIIAGLIIMLISATPSSAQENTLVTRIARLTVDSTKLDQYTSLLQEQMQTAIRKEPGVISYNVYADKYTPHKLTIIEVYASNQAYLAHREAPHFVKYKDAVANMVTSLELIEVDKVFTAEK